MIFIQKLFTLRVNFGFHDPPLLTFKLDLLDLRGLDPGEVTSKAHQSKMSACERSLLYSCFEKGCPTKPYATMPKGIMGDGGSWSLVEVLGVSAT